MDGPGYHTPDTSRSKCKWSIDSLPPDLERGARMRALGMVVGLLRAWQERYWGLSAPRTPWERRRFGSVQCHASTGIRPKGRLDPLCWRSSARGV